MSSEMGSQKIHPGDDVMHCGVHCKVASVYKGTAELTTLSGVLITYRAVETLHKIAAKQPSNRGHGVRNGYRSHVPTDDN